MCCLVFFLVMKDRQPFLTFREQAEKAEQKRKQLQEEKERQKQMEKDLKGLNMTEENNNSKAKPVC